MIDGRVSAEAEIRLRLFFWCFSGVIADGSVGANRAANVVCARRKTACRSDGGKRKGGDEKDVTGRDAQAKRYAVEN